MVRKTKEDARITRSRILDAAMELFERQGVSRTSLNDIAHHAGVTRGAIYWHFKNKVELFTAMIERLACPLLLEREKRARLMQENPLEFLDTITREFIGRLEHDPNFFRMFEIFWHKCEYVGEMEAIRHKHLKEGESHIDIIQRSFAIAREKGQIGADLTPHQAAIGLVALIDGLIFNWTKNRALFSLETYAPQIFNAFLRGIRT
ncbi:MAG: TetR family transcriptional regulator [Zoogloeaceae bacterium]|jgi:TetR/AcrR family acrAB operon transcriptional repressor|nr:TetR family transcriptional regulator [Zoogloeaceae bacterium]